MARTPRVAIIGAGIVGCSLADELVLRGWSDVTVIEQGPLFTAGGSTSHAPGLVFQTNPSRTMTGFATYTVEKSLSFTLDGAWCFNQVGSLEFALTEDRLRELHRRKGYLDAWGVEAHVIDPDETARLWPLVDRDAILGAYHVPTDGLCKAVRVSEAQARRATEGGATFLERHTVTGIRTDDGRVRAVITDRGEIPADIVVCAAGIWGPLIGAMVGVTVPLQPLAHQYAKSSPLPEMAALRIPVEREEAYPVIRVQDRDLYFREHVDRLGVGTYAHDPLPVDPATILHPTAAPVMPATLPFTPESYEGSWRAAQAVVPALRGDDVRIEEGFNGIFSFTPDGMPLMGESRDVGGFWMAEAVWVTHACGVAKAMAEWLVDGGSPTDLHECDIARFEPHQLAPDYIHDRGVQNYVEVYDIIHPLQPMEHPRPLRTSPFHEREAALGAVFLEGNGWERPQWYEANAGLLDSYGADLAPRDDWSARYWSPIAGAEARATRDGVALFDMTSLKRIEVTGPGSLAFLDRMTTNRLDRPVGTVVYTLMLDERGGIRSDLTIARLGRDRFQVGANGNLDLDWLDRHAPADGSVTIRDTTAGTCCIGLWGPFARDLLAPLTDADVSGPSFGYFRARELFVRNVPVTALRLSYVGELGWELYTTADMGAKLWDTLWTAGRPYGVIAAGRSAFGSMRLEKGYRSWGIDMTTEDDPYQAGLAFAVRMDKADFVGRAALEEGRSTATASRRLVALTLDDREIVLMGKEPVVVDGAVAGYVTSAGYGFTIDASIAYAWLPAAAGITRQPGARPVVRQRPRGDGHRGADVRSGDGPAARLIVVDRSPRAGSGGRRRGPGTRRTWNDPEPSAGVVDRSAKRARSVAPAAEDAKHEQEDVDEVEVQVEGAEDGGLLHRARVDGQVAILDALHVIGGQGGEDDDADDGDQPGQWLAAEEDVEDRGCDQPDQADEQDAGEVRQRALRHRAVDRRPTEDRRRAQEGGDDGRLRVVLDDQAEGQAHRRRVDEEQAQCHDGADAVDAPADGNDERKLCDEQQEDVVRRERGQRLAALDPVGDARRHDQADEHPQERLGQECLGQPRIRLDAEGGGR